MRTTKFSICPTTIWLPKVKVQTRKMLARFDFIGMYFGQSPEMSYCTFTKAKMKARVISRLLSRFPNLFNLKCWISSSKIPTWMQCASLQKTPPVEEFAVSKVDSYKCKWNQKIPRHCFVQYLDRNPTIPFNIKNQEFFDWSWLAEWNPPFTFLEKMLRTLRSTEIRGSFTLVFYEFVYITQTIFIQVRV